MKSTLNHKVYNTETANFVAEAGTVMAGNDFRAWKEKLYLTPKGSWFLHGSGGPMSKYAEHNLNRSTDGERIVPMTEYEALAWCEEHGAQKAIEQHFSHLIEEA